MCWILGARSSHTYSFMVHSSWTWSEKRRTYTRDMHRAIIVPAREVTRVCKYFQREKAQGNEQHTINMWLRYKWREMWDENRSRLHICFKCNFNRTIWCWQTKDKSTENTMVMTTSLTVTIQVLLTQSVLSLSLFSLFLIGFCWRWPCLCLPPFFLSIYLFQPMCSRYTRNR